MESIIVITIIVIMTGTVAFSGLRYIEQARRARTEAQISTLRLALHAYFLDTGRYPTVDQGLDALWERPVLTPVPHGWRGPYLEGPVGTDGWGRELEYRRSQADPVPFVIRSFGADGLAGGTGDDADVSSIE